MTRTRKQKTVSAVETSFEILDILSRIEPAGVSEITEEIQMSTSTVFSHVNTLVQEGYVMKNDTQYVRSLRFLEAAGTIRQRCEATQHLQEHVTKLASETGEIAGAATEERGQRVILYRSAGEMAAGDKLPIGAHSDLHWTSLGKALLAHLPPERRSEIVDQHGLPRGTDNTFTERDTLGEELERIRQQGYAVDDEEHLSGVRGIAVPIFDAQQNVIASLGLTGPRSRFDPSYLTRLLRHLEQAKNESEVRIQYYA